MARRELGPAALRVAQAVGASLPGGEFVVGCSGGADSMALAMAARWAATRIGIGWRAIVIDHGLQSGSDEVAAGVVAQLTERGVHAESVRVEVGSGNTEASAREARLAALASTGRPVLLGHTLDDQAETVLLGLARGSGVRSLAGMARVRGPFIRPLLGLRRTLTEQACREWGLQIWDDPHNADERFARVRVRHRVVPTLERELGPGIAEALARTAEIARADADLLDSLAGEHEPGQSLSATWLAGVDPPLRRRLILRWMREQGASNVTREHVNAVEMLVTQWCGQKGVDVGGLRIVRRDGRLTTRPSRIVSPSELA